MKKLISAVLATLLIFSCMAPVGTAFAVDADDTPIVMIRGNGNTIYKVDDNGNEIALPSTTDGMGDKVLESTVNILIPFLTEGLLQNEWDNYYEVCYEEIAPLYEEMRLDGNGNPQYNSGICAADKASNASTPKYDVLSWKNQYNALDYIYWYDWRLDPYDVVDDFFNYIKTVSETTGRKVTLAGNCIGGSYVYAFLEKYCIGENPIGLQYVDRVFFNATVANGTAVLTDAFCGEIEIDPNGIQRFVDEYVDGDSDGFGFELLSTETTKEINQVILTTVDMLVQLGLLKKLGIAIDELYARVYEVLVPMLVIAFYGTMPGYWTLIQSDRYEQAKNFVFSTDEYKAEYAGVIEKIDNYHAKVASRRYEIIAECQSNGIYFGGTAKYGTQMYPFVKSQNMFADEMASFYEASFGATTADNVYKTLSDEYIKAATENGTDKYISPDGKVDASTSLFKDSIWIEKNVNHDYLNWDWALAEAFSRTPNFTVWIDPAFPQYTIAIPGTEKIDPETGEKIQYSADIVPMTKENCHLSNWDEIPDSTKQGKSTVFTKLMSFFNWLLAMFKLLFSVAGQNKA